jgi:hypothetical protein
VLLDIDESGNTPNGALDPGTDGEGVDDEGDIKGGPSITIGEIISGFSPASGMALGAFVTGAAGAGIIGGGADSTDPEFHIGLGAGG